ncbi:ABC-2 type transporter-domain-containing protein [Talaromyces proteolyticus]|uniref:ABC-2 type transporter-domain-containing protein n=1 Tax=Talaromyces proteolyticus TaxID=1131652 RepID=A0AAD4KN04_9EURO|nr:ABC-2 type transporter-domain-containing protein [Talaromyces proteolyticus]KAH8695317.1 ABC-2 type transporter-domain-containing protein [Talaromyces proteolyticus]
MSANEHPEKELSTPHVDYSDEEKTVKDNSISPSVLTAVSEEKLDGEPGASVARLARQFTKESINQLDPNSPDFSPIKWVKTCLQASARDPEKYPLRSSGIAHRNLNAWGVGLDVNYQADVFSIFLRGVDLVRSWIGRRERRVQILRNFDGLVKSGEMLLVLGRPGSGVSTYLKTIAGETYGFHVNPESQFNYQGIPYDIMHSRFRGEVIYQAETEIHFPQLTVGETLLFAALARTPQNRFPGVTRKRHAEHLKDVVMAMLGLSHTMNTKVGNDFIRGVSGGERKRVSIAEVMLSQSPLQCWDNSTRGLDSATALEFVKTLKLATNLGNTTAVVAIYQASQAAYDIFDKVTVLYEGRQIYFGPANSAKKYFINMGYHCPDRQTTADFLTSLTNPEERIVRPGFENKLPRTAPEFEAAWLKSPERAQLLAEIASFEKEFPLKGQHFEQLKMARKVQQAPLLSAKSPYTISVPMQISLCITRGFQRLRGDLTFFFATIFGNLFISLVLGSVFYNLPPTSDSVNNRCILLFFVILFNALSSSLEVLTLYVQRPVVEKHAKYALYHPFSEAAASMICDLPCKIISTVCFNVPVYFMSDLRREAGAFFTFLLLSFTCTLTMSSIFRTIGQSSRTIAQALTPAAIFVIILIVYTGFVLPTSVMQGWLRWINYLDPIAYAYESLLVNEFHNRQFDCLQFIPMGPGYENLTKNEKICATPGGLPGQSFVNGDLYIDGSFGYKHSHLWRNFGILVAYIFFFTVVYFLAAEYIPSSRSKGEILVFRHGKNAAPKGIAQPDDIENASYSRVSYGVIQRHEDKENSATIQKQTAVFHWRDVCYDVQIKGETRRILDHVDGWVKPGTLTALMGATGAGKTTLLNVLASRITVGVVTGNVFVNGLPRDKSFQRKTGYVQQQDVHLEVSTVREALEFSALLRQPPKYTREEKLAYVDEVVKLLDMEAYVDAIVGVVGEGLNVEQRKRLSIGVELAARPELLLFLDEPTSGLDSQTAWSVTSLIKKLSDNGQAILCTIHQPSAMLFQQFDRLLLLAKGGKTVYFGDIGENSKDLVGYFEKYGSHPCGKDENPAEWMLRVIGAAPGAVAEQDWANTWRTSTECAEIHRELSMLEEERLSEGSQEEPAPNDETSQSTAYAASLYDQLVLCTKRVFEQYWRTPSYIYSKLILCFGTSLIIGVSFYKAENTVQGLQDQMFAIFMLIVIFAFLVYQIMPNFILQRDLYEVRERPSKTYAWYVFMLSNIIVELPWNTLAALLIYFPFYYLVGLYRNAEPTDAVHQRGGLMFLLTWSFMMMAGTFSHMIVAGLPTAEVGAVIALVLFAFSLIFCGVLATPAALPGFWIFMYRVSPFTYLISGLLSTSLANADVQCASFEIRTILQPPSGETCGQYLAEYMSFAGGAVYNPDATENCQFCSLANTDEFLASVDVFFSDAWRNYGLMWVYIIFNVIAAVGLYWVLRVPKNGNTMLSDVNHILTELSRWSLELGGCKPPRITNANP